MVAILGALTRGVRGGYVNGLLTSRMQDFTADYWPRSTARMARKKAGAYVSNVPVDAPSHPLVGYRPASYFRDFYFRVHVRPSLLDMGNLITSQVRTVSVWNAWPDRALTLQDVEKVNADGISATGPGELPLNFNPLQERQWQIAVDTNGPPLIDARINWLFAGMTPVTVQITGNRLVAWTIPPRWHNGMLERLEWFSEEQQAVAGNRVVYPLRDSPRRTWEFDVRVANADRWLLESSLYDWSARNWAFPVSPDHQLLKTALTFASVSIPIATTSLDYTPGGLVMLWNSPTQYELVEVSGVAANALLLTRPTANAWPQGTRVYPVRITRLSTRPQLQRPTTRRVDAHVVMEAVEPCDWPAIAPPTTYAGYPVLEHRAEVSTVPTAIYDRDLTVLDGGIGPVSVRDATGLVWGSQTHVWKLYGRADRAALRSLMYYMQGRVGQLWLPTGQDDIELTAIASAASPVITIAWCGYSRFLHGQPGRKRIQIELVDGTVLYRAITNWIEIDATTEQLSLDASLGRDVTPAQVASISYLALCSMASDAVEIQHVTDSEGQAICVVQFAQVPGNE